jgi:hypothetical protein
MHKIQKTSIHIDYELNRIEINTLCKENVATMEIQSIKLVFNRSVIELNFILDNFKYF